jgi:ribonuclease G
LKKILINCNPWETRIAITKDGRLENIYFSSHSRQVLERAFFKGEVSKVLPGIQTAFVDIGQQKAGFLHISEIDRDLAVEKMSEKVQIDDDEVVTSAPKQKYVKPDIAKILKEKDKILVQVGKEPVYEKGAKLTTCFTLPGRFVVLMPNISRLGVSKKIEDPAERKRLKDIVKKYLPEGMGGIIRTTSVDHDEKELAKDVTYLVGTWEGIEKKFAQAKVGEMLHEDLDLSLQMVRDYLDNDVEAIITDDKANQDELYRFVKNVAPEYTQKIKLYTGVQPVFDFYDIESQIEQALEKRAELKSGGSLIIESTEAMTVIDVNTGKFVGKQKFEETILKTNMEAAQEVARQLRLRNIGGLIVIDFIDMASGANRKKLFNFFEKTLREKDKFQSVVLKISEFGLVQMTRKRSGKTLSQQLTQTCSDCSGTGVVRSLPTESHAILRDIKQALLTEGLGAKITITLWPAIFNYITETEYDAILELERIANAKITLVSDQHLAIHEYTIEKK